MYDLKETADKLNANKDKIAIVVDRKDHHSKLLTCFIKDVIYGVQEDTIMIVAEVVKL